MSIEGNQLMPSVWDHIADGLGTSIKPPSDIFFDMPPQFAEFVASKQFLGQPPLFPRQASALECLGLDPAGYFAADKVTDLIVLEWGKGSGKDLVVSYLMAYLAYVLLSMRDMQQYVGMAPGEPIDMLMVASSQKQSSDILFAKLINSIRKPCFSKFSPVINVADIEFPRGLRQFAFHSKSDSYEGYSPLVWAMAEASAFRDAADRSNAEKVFKTLKSSARSRYVNRWLGLVTSFPRRVGDFIERKYEETIKNPRYKGDLGAAWEIRGDRTFEDYKDDFDEDYEYATAVYACKPLATTGKWYTDLAALKDCFSHSLKNEVEYEPVVTSRKARSGLKEFAAVDVVKTDPVKDAIYVGHGDPGEREDSFSFTISRLGKAGWDSELKLPAVETVAVLLWEPDPKAGRTVDFINATDTIVELHKSFGFRRVTFDRFNSAMLIQRMLEDGVPAEDSSFSGSLQLQMYRNHRMMVNNGLWACFPHKKCETELRELVRTRTRPDHPEGGSKDIADGVVATSWYLGTDEDLRPITGTRMTDIQALWSEPRIDDMGFVLDEEAVSNV